MNILKNFFIEAQIMPARLRAGVESLEIYKKNGLMFLEYSNGSVDERIFQPISLVESGFILIFPFISNLLKIDYQTIANYFFYFFLFLSIVSIFYLISTSVNRIYYKIISYVFVILVNFYMYNRLFGLVVEWALYFYSVQLILPIAILIINKKIKSNFFIITPIFFIGLLLDQFRSYASLGAIIFFTFVLVINTKKIFKKSVVLGLFVFYIIAPLILNNYIETKQNENYYKLFNSNYHSDVKMSASIWYTAYRGLGFITGKIKGYHDEVILEFLETKRNNKNFSSSNENNKLLKNEIIRIIKTDPGFAVRLYSAKFGVILLYFIIFANVGLYLFLKSSAVKPSTKIAFLLTFIAYSIPPMLAIPGLAYLGGIVGLGMIMFCYMLGLVELKNS